MQVSEANQEYNEEIIAEREAILQRKKRQNSSKVRFRIISSNFLTRLQTI